MKVETSFTINDEVVFKKFESECVVVYENRISEVLYIVDKNTSELLLKIDLECGMSQGCGYIESVKYKTFGKW